jgi:hypothetical protein
MPGIFTDGLKTLHGTDRNPDIGTEIESTKHYNTGMAGQRSTE